MADEQLNITNAVCVLCARWHEQYDLSPLTFLRRMQDLPAVKRPDRSADFVLRWPPWTTSPPRFHFHAPTWPFSKAVQVSFLRAMRSNLQPHEGLCRFHGVRSTWQGTVPQTAWVSSSLWLTRGPLASKLPS